jgi:multidrug efflux pump subunit AcrB
LENETPIRDALVDIKDAVDRVNLPSEADDPIVTEFSQPKIMFTAILKAS